MSSCQIIKLDCSNYKDVQTAKMFKKLEREQRDSFGDYLSLILYDCDKEEYKYYISYKQDENLLCGVGLIEITNNSIILQILSSRTASDTSYKGTGTSIMKEIISDYFENDNLVGIILTSDTRAVPFYEKLNRITTIYKSNNTKENKMYDFFIPFKSALNYEYSNIEVAQKHLLIALDLQLDEMVDNILAMGIPFQSEFISYSKDEEVVYGENIMISKYIIDKFNIEITKDNFLLSLYDINIEVDLILYMIEKNPSLIDLIIKKGEEANERKLINKIKSMRKNIY